MRRKLSDEDIEMIRVFGEFSSARSIASTYGVNPLTIRNILTGKSWSAPVQARKDRKLSDDEVREMRRLASKGHKEHAIRTLMGTGTSRSVIRQVIAGESYRDVR